MMPIKSIGQVDRLFSTLLRLRLTNYRATKFVSFATPDVKSVNLTEFFGAIPEETQHRGRNAHREVLRRPPACYALRPDQEVGRLIEARQSTVSSNGTLPAP
jgi:hypothetical protein